MLSCNISENIDAVPVARTTVSETNTPISAVPQNLPTSSNSAPPTPSSALSTPNASYSNLYGSNSSINRNVDSPRQVKKQTSFNSNALTRPKMSRSDEVKFDQSIIDVSFIYINIKELYIYNFFYIIILSII